MAHPCLHDSKANLFGMIPQKKSQSSTNSWKMAPEHPMHHSPPHIGPKRPRALIWPPNSHSNKEPLWCRSNPWRSRPTNHQSMPPVSELSHTTQLHTFKDLVKSMTLEVWAILMAKRGTFYGERFNVLADQRTVFHYKRSLSISFAN